MVATNKVEEEYRKRARMWMGKRALAYLYQKIRDEVAQEESKKRGGGETGMKHISDILRGIGVGK